MKRLSSMALLAMLLLAGCGTARKKTTRKPYVRYKKEQVVKAHKPKPKPEPVSDKVAHKREASSDRATDTFESTSVTTVYTDVVRAYIAQYSTIAMNQMRTYGVPASITLAQGILESGAGRGELVLKANNHFGIKCHKEWDGPSVHHDDDLKGECFRKYEHPEHSFRDHSLFLSGRSRYAELFQLDPNDYKGWAHGLKAAGYATDPKYPAKLISIIERYQLHDFDARVTGKQIVAPVVAAASRVHVVQKGDTLFNISKRYNMTVEEIKAINNLSDNHISIGQELNIK